MKNFILLLVLFCTLQCGNSNTTPKETPAFEPVEAESQVTELPASYYENAGFTVTPATSRKYKAIFEPADPDPGPIPYIHAITYDSTMYDSFNRMLTFTTISGYWQIDADTLPPSTIQIGTYDGPPSDTWELAVTNEGAKVTNVATDSCYCYFDKTIAEDQGKVIMILTTQDIHDAVVATICTSNYRGAKKLVIKCQWQDLFHYIPVDQELVREYMIPNTYNHILFNICPDCK